MSTLSTEYRVAVGIPEEFVEYWDLRDGGGSPAGIGDVDVDVCRSRGSIGVAIAADAHTFGK